MKLFLLCFAQTVMYTLGVIVTCGLAVEVCYRLCFIFMGKRTGRTFWLLTSFLGTPVHEGGHALMCLLFAHRIEKIRLIPTRAGGAMVEHSYDRRNVYATFGNLWIGLGPMLSGLSIILLILHLVWPETMKGYHELARTLLADGAPIDALADGIWACLQGLLIEDTRAVWVRILAAVALFSLALHVRLSGADVRGMLSGLPIFAVLGALVALVVTLLGEAAVSTWGLWLIRAAWLLALLFSLILMLGCVQLVLAALLRLVYTVASVWRGGRPDQAPCAYHDYRDRDFEEFDN